MQMVEGGTGSSQAHVSMTGKGDTYRDDMGFVMLALNAIAPFDDTLAQHKH